MYVRHYEKAHRKTLYRYKEAVGAGEDACKVWALLESPTKARQLEA